MTQSEINIQQSENSLLVENQSQNDLISIGSTLQYSIFNTENQFKVVASENGYINFLLPNNAENVTIQLKGKTYFLCAGENMIFPISESDQINVINNHPSNKILTVLIPSNSFISLDKKIKENYSRFEQGLRTKSDPKLILSLNQILELDSLENWLHLLKIQSLLLDIIIHQVEGLFAENAQGELISKKIYFDKIQEVKRIIDQDLSLNYNLSELAKAVGTNEQYLKKYFKQQYGKTVMGYITEQKMELAKKLILAGEHRISDVARLTGYKHSTHFTTAFKKYFGFIPNSLKYSFLFAHKGIEILPEIAESLFFL